MVALQVLGATAPVGLTSLGHVAALGCGTLQASGGGIANIVFGTAARCQFQQSNIPEIAVMRTREPDGTLLRVDNGQVLCTTSTPGQQISLCGEGDIQTSGAVNQLMATCTTDPAFSVAVFAGNVIVTDPSGQSTPVGTDQQIVYVPSPTTTSVACPPKDTACHLVSGGIKIVPVPTRITATDAQAAVLSTQARSLGLEPARR